MNAVGAKIASFIPPPNLAGQTNNLVVAPNARNDAYDSHVIRIDQVINEKERFFSRFVRGYRTETNGDYGFQHSGGDRELLLRRAPEPGRQRRPHFCAVAFDRVDFAPRTISGTTCGSLFCQRF